MAPNSGHNPIQGPIIEARKALNGYRQIRFRLLITSDIDAVPRNSLSSWKDSTSESACLRANTPLCTGNMRNPLADAGTQNVRQFESEIASKPTVATKIPKKKKIPLCSTS